MGHRELGEERKGLGDKHDAYGVHGKEQELGDRERELGGKEQG